VDIEKKIEGIINERHKLMPQLNEALERAKKARGVKFGRTSKPLPENLYSIYHKITGL